MGTSQNKYGFFDDEKNSPINQIARKKFLVLRIKIQKKESSKLFLGCH
jgi:hypothetical protein